MAANLLQSWDHSLPPTRTSPSNDSFPSPSCTFAPAGSSLQNTTIRISPHLARRSQAEQDASLAERSTDFQLASKESIASLLQENTSVAEGELLHAQIVHAGLHHDIFLANLLVSAYGRFGLVDEAGRVFDAIPRRSVVSWSAIISAYTTHGHDEKAIAIFREMNQSGLKPNDITFIRVFTACANQNALEDGRYAHALLIAYGNNVDHVTGTALLTMYGKCGELDAAKHVFHIMEEHDTISWNAMMAALKHNDDNAGVGFVLELMQERDMHLNRSTFLTSLAAYASTGTIDKGRLIHDHIVKGGLDRDIDVANALIHMYGICGALDEAKWLFERMQQRDVVSWNSMIAAYAQGGSLRDAYGLFQQMQTHVKPTRATFLNMLSACSSPESLSVGESIHTHISQVGLDSDLLVATALIDMYQKCGAPANASKVFNNIEDPDITCWNSMIDCYSQHGKDDEAIRHFERMFQTGLDPDNKTLSSILGVCAGLKYLPRGKLIHAYIVENGFDSDTIIVHALIHMYGNSGNLAEARALFDKLDTKLLIAWNTMMGAYSQQGYAMQAIELYEEMLCKSIRPDEVTFVSLLSACSHAGLVDRGHEYFKSIRDVHGLTPSIGHYNCLIDLFVRAGKLDAAEDLVQLMPYKATSTIWSTISKGCG